MKRLPLLLLSGLAVAVVAACGGGPKPETPAPAVVNQDSIDAARRAEEERQRAEAEAREREAREREARQRAAGSLAPPRKSTEAGRAPLPTLNHLDHYQAIHPGGGAPGPGP